MARGRTGLLGLGVFAGLAHQGAQLLGVGCRAQSDPLAHGIVIGHQAVAPDFRLVQHQSFLGAGSVLLTQRNANFSVFFRCQ